MKKTLRKICYLLSGIFGVAVFVWTPRTWGGFIAYGALLLACVLFGAASIDYEKDTGYWPDPPGERALATKKQDLS